MSNSKECKDCESSIRRLNHPCTRHSECFSINSGWNPNSCNPCISLFVISDKSNSPNEGTDYLISLAKKFKLLKPKTLCKNSIFADQDISAKFSRNWLKRAVKITDSRSESKSSSKSS